MPALKDPKTPSSSPGETSHQAAPAPQLSEYRVVITDLEVSALVGVTEEERSVRQRLRLNLSALAQPAHPISDRLDTVVCYAQLRNIILEVVEKERSFLIETLAQRIAHRCLEDLRLIRLTLRVEKLEVFPDVGSVGIEMTFDR